MVLVVCQPLDVDSLGLTFRRVASVAVGLVCRRCGRSVGRRVALVSLDVHIVPRIDRRVKS